MRRIKLFSALISVSILAVGIPAVANDGLITQLENLRNGLAIKDEGRKELSLRIADLHFYEAVEQAKQSDLHQNAEESKKLAAQAAKHRIRALELYQEQLSSAATIELRTKIQFQVAQLLGGLGRQNEAMPLWRTLAAQELQPKIRSEALLRLAQAAEEGGTPKDLVSAEEYYRSALKQCQSHDVCGFVRYRLAWLLKGRGKIDEAIGEIRQSLFDSRGNVQEEVLRDLLVFLSAKPGNGQDALALVDELAQKLQRPALMQRLADNFYSAGNKEAALAALRLTEDRAPSLANEIRLLEEYYGARSWDAFRSILSAAEKHVEQGVVSDETGEKLLLRLVIQLEGERDTQKQYSGDFQRVAMMYLSLFPQSKSSFRIMESWLAAETSPEQKGKQIALWLSANDSTFKLDRDKQIRLRELRASLAQEAKDHPTFQAEMRALHSLYMAPEKVRESEYLLAKSLYETKELTPALEIFRKLAERSAGSQPDKYALLSQNLALDVLNQKKDYSGIVAQAQSWLGDAGLAKIPALGADLQQMREVGDQAEFERAVELGESPEALAAFSSFCFADKLLPKSCSNARTLAFKLNDHSAMIRVLEKQGAKQELMQELEASGFFGRAAEMKEQENPLAKGKWTGAEAIKIALLYELEGRFADRDRWLKALATRYRKQPIDTDEGLFYQSLKDSNLLSPESLSIRWSAATRSRLAHDLETAGLGTKDTRRILMESPAELGEAWAFYVEKDLFELDLAQRKIGFYGKNSKANFQKRLARVQAADQFAARYLDGASLSTRISLLLRMRNIYQDLVSEIQGAPLPENLDEGTRAQITASLQEMAAPFVERVTNYNALAQAQASKLESDEAKAAATAALAKPADRTILPFERQKAAKADRAPEWEPSLLAARLKALRANPEARDALAELRDYFKNARQIRLSSYIEGRMRTVEKGSL